VFVNLEVDSQKERIRDKAMLKTEMEKPMTVTCYYIKS
jgi:hypothetical protein